MAHSHVLLGAGADPAKLTIRRIGIDDLKEALAKGADDFYAMPTHAMFLCAIYPVVGLLAARLAFGYSVLPLLYPLVTGFALVGPLAALGLYELSRRREAGQQASAAHAFDVLESSSIGAIIALGLLLMGIFALWIAVANAIYVAEFGYATPASIGGFVRDVLTTRAGWSLIVLGNFIGFLFAVLVLAVSAISFPLLLDRDVGAAVALLTSLRAVARNPITMARLGPDRGGRAVYRLAAVLPRPDRGGADPRPRHLAPLSQGDRAGREPAPDAASPPARAPLGGGFPGGAVPLGAGMTVT